MSFIRSLLRLPGRLLDPVDQNPNAILFGEHAGMLVRLRPVVEANGHIKKWVPDPQEAADAERAAATPQTPAPPTPQPTPQQPAPPPPPLPPLP